MVPYRLSGRRQKRKHRGGVVTLTGVVLDQAICVNSVRLYKLYEPYVVS